MLEALEVVDDGQTGSLGEAFEGNNGYIAHSYSDESYGAEPSSGNKFKMKLKEFHKRLMQEKATMTNNTTITIVLTLMMIMVLMAQTMERTPSLTKRIARTEPWRWTYECRRKVYFPCPSFNKQSEKGIPPVAGKSKRESKDKDKKHKKA